MYKTKRKCVKHKDKCTKQKDKCTKQKDKCTKQKDKCTKQKDKPQRAKQKDKCTKQKDKCTKQKDKPQRALLSRQAAFPKYWRHSCSFRNFFFWLGVDVRLARNHNMYIHQMIIHFCKLFARFLLVRIKGWIFKIASSLAGCCVQVKKEHKSHLNNERLRTTMVVTSTRLSSSELFC